jgi:peptidyl-tRNA hydrolase
VEGQYDYKAGTGFYKEMPPKNVTHILAGPDTKQHLDKNQTNQK